MKRKSAVTKIQIVAADLIFTISIKFIILTV